jgi:chemotaxis phosphatase CheX-like protein
MSLPVSCPRVIEHDQRLIDAFAEVAETSFFGFVDAPPDEAGFAALVAAETAWLGGRVAFAGPTLHGDLVVALPADVAAQIAAAFVGLDIDDLGPTMIADAAGEFVNMICGLWLTRTHPHERFELSAPDVTRSALAAVPAPSTHMLINDRPALFHATLGERR